MGHVGAEIGRRLKKHSYKCVGCDWRFFRYLWLIHHRGFGYINHDFPYKVSKTVRCSIYQLGDASHHWFQLITIWRNYWKRFKTLHTVQLNSTIFNEFTHYSKWLYLPLSKLIRTKTQYANKCHQFYREMSLKSSFFPEKFNR